MDKDDVRLLDQFPVFEPELLKELEAEAVLRELPPDAEIMRPGQYIKHTVLVLSGLIKVFREDEEGNEYFMYYLQPGEACAMSILCVARNEKSNLRALTAESTRIAMIPVPATERWNQKYKSWQQFVIATYRIRFEELLQVFDQIAFHSLDERLLYYLKRHAEVQGDIIHRSHQQIAEELNSSREVISRLLKRLEQLGKISVHRNSIQLLGN